MEKSIFEAFTNLYSLSKTLRLELKTIGKTLKNMKKKIKLNKNLGRLKAIPYF